MFLYRNAQRAGRVRSNALSRKRKYPLHTTKGMIAMSKRLLIGLAPLLAVAAFAVMPVAAQAAGPQWYVCQKVTLKTGKFTKINCAIEKAESNFEKVLIGNLSSAVLVVSKHVAGHKAVLRAPKIASGIECEIVKDESWLWNSRMRGRDI